VGTIYALIEMQKRRDFIKQVINVLGITPVIAVQACTINKSDAEIKGSMIGADSNTGHLLRDHAQLPKPTAFINTDILIAGGGISGLSAMRYLRQNSENNVLMIDMGSKIGGNSIYGENSQSRYPWAAHYITIPNNSNTDLIEFLHSIGVITSFDENGIPIYNEYHLCHDPEERLYIKGYWQDGLVPHFGISPDDKKQTKRFFEYVEKLKLEKGNDGKYHFDIPIEACSNDTLYKVLDSISFRAFLSSEAYTSASLLWYLEYCCKDDYGGNLEQVSAWAGLQYFASRRGIAANAHGSSVLTWPEGNGYLMTGLQRQCGNDILKDKLLYKITATNTGVNALCYDPKTKKTIQISAQKIILSTPQYVNKHLLCDIPSDRTNIYIKTQYAPWVVANIILRSMPEGKGAPLSWDNVVYGQDSVGYVFANHQQLNSVTIGTITYYLPLIDQNTTAARVSAYKKNYDYWKNKIIKDLEQVHNGISKEIVSIDICVWGHGMILPSPGYIWGEERQKALASIDNKIFFAHTDLSGISIFEEGFYQGIRAAKEIILRS
jgi:hypothetical protein